MTWYLAAGVTFLLVCLQTMVLPRASVLGARPDLVVVAAIAWALVRNGDEAFVWGLAGGLFVDLFSAAPLGASVAALCVVVRLAGALAPTLRRFRSTLPFLLIPAGVALYHLLWTLLLAIAGHPVSWVGLAVALPAILLVDAFAAIPVYATLRLISWQLRPLAWQSP